MKITDKHDDTIKTIQDHIDTSDEYLYADVKKYSIATMIKLIETLEKQVGDQIDICKQSTNEFQKKGYSKHKLGQLTVGNEPVIHSYSCKQCDQKFATLGKLATHNKIYHINNQSVTPVVPIESNDTQLDPDDYVLAVDI